MSNKQISHKQFSALLEDAIAIEAEEAKAAGAIGYMARVLTQATIPHSRQEGNEFIRVNGNLTMTILAPSAVGLPYGTVPRLLLTWISTEAVLKQTPHLELGASLSSFMAELGLMPTGGRWGSITRLRSQMNSLFSSFISCDYKGEQGTTELDEIKNILMVDQASLWWSPKDPEQSTLWQSTLDLNPTFYKEIIDRPVPIDLRAIKSLKRSPMALDIYAWLTYRLSYLKQPRVIPWPLLQMQFGSQYAEDRKGRHAFKRAFLKHLEAVQLIYPGANVEEHGKSNGLLLKPSATHIKKLSK